MKTQHPDWVNPVPALQTFDDILQAADLFCFRVQKIVFAQADVARIR